MQSQDVQLPEDFLVRVDSGKLEVALESFGLIEENVPRSNLLVHLINSAGQDQVATTNEQGVAEFDGVEPDQHYAVLVATNNAHAAAPVVTVGESLASAKGIKNTAFRLPVSEPNKEEILGAINRDIPPTGDAPAGELFQVATYQQQTMSSYRVHLQQDGKMLGRVVVLDRDLKSDLRYAKLNFLKNNRVQWRVDSNPIDGSFNLSGIEPGIYGVIAAGPAGYAAFNFEVSPFESLTSIPRSNDNERPVSLRRNVAADQLCVCLIPQKMLPATTDIIRRSYGTNEPPADALADGLPPPAGGGAGSPTAGGFGAFGGGGGFGGGGFGGGASGGGGGLFSGGGLGNIAGIAGLAAIAAVVADDDSSSNNNLVSPITR